MSLYQIVQRSERALVRLSYRLKHGMEKLARHSNHLTFLIRCRNNGIIPQGLRISLPAKLHNTRKLNDISTKTSGSLLRALISDTRTKKARIKKEIDTLTAMIRNDEDEERRSRIISWCSQAAEKAFAAAKTRQKLKFEKLRDARHTTPLDPKKVVKNFSSRSLTDDEERVLALGLNYAVAPKQVPYQEIIVATEATARQLDAESAKTLRVRVSDALRTARPPQSNLDKGMKKALKDLKKDEEIVILPADKGNATVVMDRSEYLTKMNGMLEEDTYKELKRDPTSRVETRITKKLKELEKKGYISDKERKFLSPHCSNPPPEDSQRGNPPQTHSQRHRLSNIPPSQETGQDPLPSCWQNQFLHQKLHRLRKPDQTDDHPKQRHHGQFRRGEPFHQGAHRRRTGHDL